MREELELGECSHSKAAAIDDDNPGKYGNDVVVPIEDLAEFMKEELASKRWSPPTYSCTISKSLKKSATMIMVPTAPRLSLLAHFIDQDKTHSTWKISNGPI
ncbi:hypothetical protein AAC387_Pa02g0138 [Persea americana]